MKRDVPSQLHRDVHLRLENFELERQRRGEVRLFWICRVGGNVRRLGNAESFVEADFAEMRGWVVEEVLLQF